MQPTTPPPRLAEDVFLRLLMQSTGRETGEAFFRALVRNLASALDTFGAWVTEYDPERRRLKALAFHYGGTFIEWEGGVDGTPCEHVVDEVRPVLLPERVLELYPHAVELRGAQAVSYLGVPLQAHDGAVIGHLAVLDRRPMREEPRLLAVLSLFAERAAAELLRLRSEREIREREERLSGLLGGAMDAILELDHELGVTLANPAAERVLGADATRLCGLDFRALLAPVDAQRLTELSRELALGPRRSLWIPDTLGVRALDGRTFTAEASLACHHRGKALFHTLILRDVEQRLAAEERIRALRSETRYLREELSELASFEGILGRSPALIAVLREIEQVAPTSASVLVLGETGTGKELVARAIHAASQRSAGPLVRLNCAAIPATLIESELFGHEKGAFTGATERREGRFALADGGTIFLDEIGELTPELQAKLLRVLQEGEFEPLGGSRTRKVDVRVISATHRDLEQLRREGRFREDLYYRLGVYPLRVPPLRERGDDVILLAEHFLERFARKSGRSTPDLSPASRQRLRAYDWPGNVRELANVIERAVITARDGRLDLERAIPGVSAPPPAAVEAGATAESRIRTASELEALERENLLRALEASAWKISGADGAAARVGLKPSTLASRMKALGLSRPR